jgi:hypothetical protein
MKEVIQDRIVELNEIITDINDRIADPDYNSLLKADERQRLIETGKVLEMNEELLGKM